METTIKYQLMDTTDNVVVAELWLTEEQANAENSEYTATQQPYEWVLVDDDHPEEGMTNQEKWDNYYEEDSFYRELYGDSSDSSENPFYREMEDQ